MPKIFRVLMRYDDGELLRPLTEVIKLMIQHDSTQFFAWTDEEGKGGLEVGLLVVDRLLSSEMDDFAAGEVGGLAGVLVEKAGAEQLGTFLPAILRALVHRAASTEQPGFIQSLMMVFARLSIISAKEVVDFLGATPIDDKTALTVIMNKWLEYTTNFAGFDEIRQNAMALSKIFALGDPRLDEIMVKGELIPDTSNRIKTRSRSKHSRSSTGMNHNRGPQLLTPHPQIPTSSPSSPPPSRSSNCSSPNSPSPPAAPPAPAPPAQNRAWV